MNKFIIDKAVRGPWRLYEWVEAKDDQDGPKDNLNGGRYLPISEHETEEAARAALKELENGG